MLGLSNTEANELQEDQSYLFNVLKNVTLPGGNEHHFVLAGPNDKRYLLRSSYYSHYPIRVGSSIPCRVDKINCSGQVFLEPAHPYYSEGQRYDFLLLRITEDLDIWGKTIHTAWVRDLHWLEWPCPIKSPHHFEPGLSHLSCRVERIRKGQLILSLPSILGFQVKLRKGQIYDFKVHERKEYIQYYVLEGPNGSYHKIPQRFYQHFNYEIGTDISGKVLDIEHDGSYKIEPLNPYYRINQVYMFKFLRMETRATGLGEKSGIIWVLDHFGQPNKMKAHEWQLAITDYHPEMLPCRVMKFKKGRLLLENLADEN